MTELPLFPLRVALFPGVTLPLRIFEQRYIHLVSESLKSGSGFGVVLIRSGGEVGHADIWPIGLQVQIVDWSQGEEGLLHVDVAGSRRFRVVDTRRDEHDLLIGMVEWLDDNPVQPIPSECDGLLGMLDELKEHAAMLSFKFAPVDSADALSWQLTQLLPFEDRDRVDMLAMSDPLERLASIAAHLERWTRQ